MNIKIRPATTQDDQEIKRMIGALMDHVVSTDPIKRIRHMDGYIEHQFKIMQDNVKNQDGIILVAQEGDVVIGFAVGIVGRKQSPENLLEVIPTQLGVLKDLYVNKEHRAKGVGGKLLAKIEQYLASKGCDSLWVEVFAPNQKALDFYSQNKFMTREIGMLKHL